MPVQVKVRAVIWIDEQIVVHKANQRGALHITLPGGRVNDRESVIDALEREAREELGIRIAVGDLMFSAEVISGARRQDIELVFEAKALDEIAASSLELVDPREPGLVVLPPVLSYVAAWREGKLRYRWLGNIYANKSALLSQGAADEPRAPSSSNPPAAADRRPAAETTSEQACTVQPDPNPGRTTWKPARPKENQICAPNR